MKEIDRRRTITVFCAASDVAEKYMDDARQFGQLMVGDGYDLVWGGSDKGVMKLIASTVQDSGGQIFGITFEDLKEHARPNADEMMICQTLDERKAMLLERGDAIIAMPGGIGTWDEAFHILEHKKHGRHQKPVVFLNTDGYYEGLKMQFARAIADGFAKPGLAFFANTPQEAIDYINSQLS